MQFENDKKVALSKSDKSKKGSVDNDIGQLTKYINSHPNYYTTSSCSGRICLLRVGKKGKKDTSWIFVSHNTVKFKEIKNSLQKLPGDKLWFQVEPMILHVRCKSIDDANRLLYSAQSVGLKHSGITSIKRKIMVEIRGNEHIATIIAKDRKSLIGRNYLNFLVNEGNLLLKRTKQKIRKLDHKLRCLY